jgi:hypothetical protein
MEKMNKIKRTLPIAFCFVLLPNKSQAQAGVKIVEETCVNAVMDLFIQKNQSIENLPGYRIQIYNGNSRDKMNYLQQKFKIAYPEIETYLVYQAPYFKLRAGDFTERVEANKFLVTIRKDYPSAFLVTEEVKIK